MGVDGSEYIAFPVDVYFLLDGGEVVLKGDGGSLLLAVDVSYVVLVDSI